MRWSDVPWYNTVLLIQYVQKLSIKWWDQIPNLSNCCNNLRILIKSSEQKKILVISKYTLDSLPRNILVPQTSVPGWSHKGTLCAAAGGRGEPEKALEDWVSPQTTAACRPPPHGQAGTRHLLPGSEARRRRAGAPWAEKPDTGRQQVSLWKKK